MALLHGAAFAFGAILLATCGDTRAPKVAPPAAALTGAPGTAVAQLDAALAARFRGGEALFNTVYRPESGLGPSFNENQCSACHTDPASGGVGGERITRATITGDDGRCDLLLERGGSNIRRKITALARRHGVEVERVPDGARRGLFTAPALYGIGYVAAIPDSEILEREDPDDRDGDGISGRAGRTADGRLARFGRKAQVATLREFVTSAMHEEMGLTNHRLMHDVIQGRRARPADDVAADPEVSDAAVNLLIDYVRLLAPLPRGTPRRPWSAADVARGEEHFRALGCPTCHVPSLETGPSDVPALGRRSLSLYSDLLLHDMGPALADVCNVTATASEVRTEPLMGLRFRELLLHDGRVTSIEDAIRAHGGEAARARDAFLRATARERLALLVFLETL